jgi:Ni/Co efflux regulator RcnB
MTMKTILSAIVALSFLAGTVAPAAAYEGFSIKTLDQDGRGGHAN